MKARDGFTLIEVLVALTLSALTVLLVHRIYRSVAGGVRQVLAHRAALDRKLNAERWLTETLRSVAVGLDGDLPFNGQADRLECTAFVRVADGWVERTRVVLSLEDSRLLARTATSEIVLADDLESGAIDYLVEPGLASRWVRSWQSPVSAPAAIRLRLVPEARGSPADTLVVLIGARG